jgi:hypothetical protein
MEGVGPRPRVSLPSGAALARRPGHSGGGISDARGEGGGASPLAGDESDAIRQQQRLRWSAILAFCNLEWLRDRLGAVRGDGSRCPAPRTTCSQPTSRRVTPGPAPTTASRPAPAPSSDPAATRAAAPSRPAARARAAIRRTGYRSAAVESARVRAGRPASARLAARRPRESMRVAARAVEARR